MVALFMQINGSIITKYKHIEQHCRSSAAGFEQLRFGREHSNDAARSMPQESLLLGMRNN
jgi:hypothetical protein